MQMQTFAERTEWLVSVSVNQTLVNSVNSSSAYCSAALIQGSCIAADSSTFLIISIFDYVKEFSWLCRASWEPLFISTDEE